MEVNYESFSPREVGLISGVTPELQRVWRKRGRLRATGRTGDGYSLLDVAELCVRHALSLRGISPAFSGEIGQQAASAVIWAALMEVEGTCEVVGPAIEVDQFVKDYDNDSALVEKLAGLLRPPEIFIVAYDAARPAFASTLEVDGLNVESGFFISLASLGRRLGEKAGKPIVHVTLSGSTQGNDRSRRLIPINDQQSKLRRSRPT